MKASSSSQRGMFRIPWMTSCPEQSKGGPTTTAAAPTVSAVPITLLTSFVSPQSALPAGVASSSAVCESHPIRASPRPSNPQRPHSEPNWPDSVGLALHVCEQSGSIHTSRTARALHGNDLLCFQEHPLISALSSSCRSRFV